MRRHLSRTGTVLVSTLLLAFAAGAAAQTKPEQPPPAASNQQQPPAPSAKTPDTKQPVAPAAAPLTPEQAKLQAQIDKLYQLAQDLKAAVAKSNKDTLSIDVIKKADAVEKAAKGLKDQMKSTQPGASH